MKACDNPFSPARVPPCRVCLGHRMVSLRDHTASPCPNCGGTQNDAKFDRLRLDAKAATWVRPEISEKDLTAIEKEIVEAWRRELPNVGTLSLLSWVEGLRYGDAAMNADKDFQKQMFHALAEWREATGRSAA